MGVRIGFAALIAAWSLVSSGCTDPNIGSSLWPCDDQKACAPGYVCEAGFCRPSSATETRETSGSRPEVGSDVFCQPECSGLECGPDPSCGASCGACPAGSECVVGNCEPFCIPDCAGLECGPDPSCGASCGACPAGSECVVGNCEPLCIPDCAGLECGPDPSCDASCGACPVGSECVVGNCEPFCIPDCAGLECGPDPSCGASCGACPVGSECVEGECVSGEDPCQGVSATGCCVNGTVVWCDDGALQAIDCAENQECGWNAEEGFYDCGTDGGASPDLDLPRACCDITATCEELGRDCGVHPACSLISCGECAPGALCSPNGVCEACDPITACVGRACGIGACGIVCGTCTPEAPLCRDGACVEGLTIGCDELVTGNNGTGTNNISSYPACLDRYESGPEIVYAFTATSDDTINVWLSGISADLALFILEGAVTGDACVVSDDQAIIGFPVSASMTYYIVVDGHGGAVSDFTLTLDCASVCADPQCGERVCGASPSPLCGGVACGECEAGHHCVGNGLACEPDRCWGVTYEGCCSDAALAWCEDGELQTLDCGSNSPPADTCGWSDGAGFFDCGGTDMPPAGVSADCGFDCETTCGELGLECGDHPTCATALCGDCEVGFACVGGLCEDCDPVLACEGRECGIGACGILCGECPVELPLCMNGVCTEIPTVSCDEVIEANNDGGANSISFYPSCAAWGESAPELLYAFTPETDDSVNLALSGLSADLDLFIITDPNDGSSCIAHGDSSVNGLAVTAGTTYYIVVDGLVGAVSDFRLTIDCLSVCPDPQCGDHKCGPAPGPLCSGWTCGTCPGGSSCTGGECVALPECVPMGIIGCGEVVAGDTSTGTNNVSSYPACVGWDESGPELVYEWIPSVDDRVLVELNILTAGADLDVFVLEGGCISDRCLAYGDDRTSFEAKAGFTYYIVVEGFGGAAGAFELSLRCNSDCDPLLACSDNDCGPSGCYERDVVEGTWVEVLCGVCGAGEWCDAGTCSGDECFGVGFEGCCDGAVVTWCEDGKLQTIDCSANAPPSDACGWTEDFGGFDCGGGDEPPAEFPVDCALRGR
jgi:hypothetical protein